MRKFFEKHETLNCIWLIILYVVINSYCKKNYGMEDYRSAIINVVFSVLLLALIIGLKRVERCGLVKIANWKECQYFIPLLVIMSVNLWNGININAAATEIVFHFITMLNVGFIEEIIFRGFLFRMMEKDNLKSAIIVSSLTFGIGHIVNLLNGEDLIPTLMQVCYAVAIGYLFVIIFYKTKSLVPCIIAHGIFNSLSIFNKENTLSIYIIPVVLVVLSVGYARYIDKAIPVLRKNE